METINLTLGHHVINADMTMETPIRFVIGTAEEQIMNLTVNKDREFNEKIANLQIDLKTNKWKFDEITANTINITVLNSDPTKPPVMRCEAIILATVDMSEYPTMTWHWESNTAEAVNVGHDLSNCDFLDCTSVKIMRYIIGSCLDTLKYDYVHRGSFQQKHLTSILLLRNVKFNE